MVNVSGYPADRGGGKELWWARNRIKAVTRRRIFYDVDTMGGQSGAPAFIVTEAGGTPAVIGIHAYGIGATPAELVMELNSAPRIVPEVADLIRSWVEVDGGIWDVAQDRPTASW
jgi:V8-like Glu-specific endopeptidase